MRRGAAERRRRLAAGTVNDRSGVPLRAGDARRRASVRPADTLLKHDFLRPRGTKKERSLSGGSLGSSVDEGRSYLREVM